MIFNSDYILNGNKSQSKIKEESLYIINSFFNMKKKIGIDFDGVLVNTGEFQKYIAKKMFQKASASTLLKAY